MADIQTNANKTQLYLEGKQAISAVKDLTSGETVDSAAFQAEIERRYGRQVTTVNLEQKGNGAWDIFNAALAAVEKQGDMNALFAENSPAGQEYRRAHVAIGIEGKVYDAYIDARASDIASGQPRDFQVQTAPYEARKVVVGSEERTIPVLMEQSRTGPIHVHRDDENVLSVDLTGGLTTEQKATQFGDPNYTLRIAENVYEPYAYQGDFLGTIAGKQNALCVAGTGVGKSPLVAISGHINGKSIMVVPGELCSDMVEEAKNFSGNVAYRLQDKDFASPAAFQAARAAHPHAIMSHEQFVEHGKFLTEHLRDDFVVFDESHKLSEGKASAKIFDQVLDHNQTVCVTATPGPKLLAKHGGRADVDAPLIYAQDTLHQVRTMDATNIRAGTPGADNKGELAYEITKNALGRETYAIPGDNGYKSPRIPAVCTVEQEVGALQAALQQNRVRTTEHQATIFTDTPELKDRVGDMIQQVQAGNFQDIAKMQREIAAMRRESELSACEAMGASPAALEMIRGMSLPAVDLAAEMAAGHRQQMTNSVNMDIISFIDPSIKLKGMQKTVRAGGDLADIADKINAKSFGEGKEAQVLEKIAEAAAHSPELQQYYAKVADGVRAAYAAQGAGDKPGSALFAIGEIEPAELGAGSLRQRVSRDDSAAMIETAKENFDKCMAPFIVSDGPLRTGFSRTDVLTSMSAIEQITGEHPDKVSQGDGRCCRAPDGRAIVVQIADANIPQALLFTTDQVLSPENTRLYAEGVEKCRAYEGRKNTIGARIGADVDAIATRFGEMGIGDYSLVTVLGDVQAIAGETRLQTADKAVAHLKEMGIEVRGLEEAAAGTVSTQDVIGNLRRMNVTPGSDGATNDALPAAKADRVLSLK